jgi:hypothetical protein
MSSSRILAIIGVETSSLRTVALYIYKGIWWFTRFFNNLIG